MSIGKQLSKWAVERVTTEFPKDVALLINHTTLQLPEDVADTGFSYYVPATNRSNGLACDFIVGGIGYDLFPFSWASLEQMADMKHYNITCLADITGDQILYACDERHRARFTALQARQFANLQNPQFMLERAKDWLGRASEAYLEMLLDGRPAQSRMNAGYVCDFLSYAVAFANGRYFVHGQTDRLQALERMEKLPEGFIACHRAIFLEKTFEGRRDLALQLLGMTKGFLESLELPGQTPHAPDGQELADWYAEMSYTWRRVRYWCEKGDAVNAYYWSCNLQNEADKMGMACGISDTDMMDAFDAENLSAYAARMDAVEQAFRQAIALRGGALREYACVEDFLKEN